MLQVENFVVRFVPGRQILGLRFVLGELLYKNLFLNYQLATEAYPVPVSTNI